MSKLFGKIHDTLLKGKESSKEDPVIVIRDARPASSPQSESPITSSSNYSSSNYTPTTQPATNDANRERTSPVLPSKPSTLRLNKLPPPPPQPTFSTTTTATATTSDSSPNQPNNPQSTLSVNSPSPNIDGSKSPNKKPRPTSKVYQSLAVNTGGNALGSNIAAKIAVFSSTNTQQNTPPVLLTGGRRLSGKFSSSMENINDSSNNVTPSTISNDVVPPPVPAKMRSATIGTQMTPQVTSSSFVGHYGTLRGSSTNIAAIAQQQQQNKFNNNNNNSNNNNSNNNTVAPSRPLPALPPFDPQQPSQLPQSPPSRSSSANTSTTTTTNSNSENSVHNTNTKPSSSSSFIMTKPMTSNVHHNNTSPMRNNSSNNTSITSNHHNNKTKIVRNNNYSPTTIEQLLQSLSEAKFHYRRMNDVESRQQMASLYGILERADYDETKVIRAQKCTRAWIRRKRMMFKWYTSAFEVLQTERSYVQNLELLVSKFMDPLFRDYRSLGLTVSEVQGLFGNVKEVLECNHELLRQLESEHLERGKKPIRLAQAFIDFSARSTQAYSDFITNSQRAANWLNRTREKKVKFDSWLNSIYTSESASLSQRKLDDFLIQPIKRVPLYILLLKANRKYIPRGDPEYRKLVPAIHGVEELADIMNRKKREADNIDRILAIKASLKTTEHSYQLPRLEDLAVPEREFVFEGPIYYLTEYSPKPQTCVLFHDILIRIREGVYDGIIYLTGATLRDYYDNDFVKNRFIITDAKNVRHLFVCQSPSSKESWLVKFRSTVVTFEDTNTASSWYALNAMNSKSGILLKIPSVVHNKRICHVDEGILYYMITKPGRENTYNSTCKPPKALQLANYSLNTDPQKPFSFKLSADFHPTVSLAATEKEEFEDWMRVLGSLTHKQSWKTTMSQ